VKGGVNTDSVEAVGLRSALGMTCDGWRICAWEDVSEDGGVGLLLKAVGLVNAWQAKMSIRLKHNSEKYHHFGNCRMEVLFIGQSISLFLSA